MNIFGYQIPLFGLLHLVGFFIGILLILYLAKHKKISFLQLYKIYIFIIIIGLIFGRLGYFFIYDNHIFIWNIINDSGQTVFGSIIGVVIFFPIIGKLIDKDYNKLIDNIMPSILILHFFAKFGCFFSGCCYGKVCNFYFAISNPNFPSNIKLHPVQLYEAFMIMLMSLYCMKLNIKGEIKYQGQVFWICGILYSIERFIAEFFRDDCYSYFLGLTIVQWLCILLFLYSISVDMYKRKKNQKNKIPCLPDKI